jgi:adenylate kinase
MKLRVIVVGIPGVGKTTVVEHLVTKVKGARLVNFGSVMLEEGKRRKWVKARDKLRKLRVEKQRELQRVSAEKISRMKDRVVLVDTHLFVRTPEGFWPGLPFEVVRGLKPTHLVLIEAEPAEIASRRATDKERYRDHADLHELEEELSIARSLLSVSSTLTGAPMLMVDNDEGKADEAANVIAVALGKAES